MRSVGQGTGYGGCWALGAQAIAELVEDAPEFGISKLVVANHCDKQASPPNDQASA